MKIDGVGHHAKDADDDDDPYGVRDDQWVNFDHDPYGVDDQWIDFDHDPHGVHD